MGGTRQQRLAISLLSVVGQTEPISQVVVLEVCEL
jgi:hypothetical protein